MNNLNKFPDFFSYGYKIIRELGCNSTGGRITYLATDTRTQQPAVIKRFMFALEAANWSGFKAYEREVQVLQGLNHLGIPRYLDSFDAPIGFCIVQEYKDAQPLSIQRSFAPDEIKRIAVSILEILVYLQSRIPPIIHRDIKPENILVDDQLNVYLVDFGFARIAGGDVAMSSVAAGTFGFMAPEQMFNRQLSEATDLYGLGATLICLLTGTKSTVMDTLIDEEGRIAFKPLVPKLSFRFIEWLEKMVQPKLKDRFANAASALEALKPLYVIRVPEVILSQSSLRFTAKKLGERLTQTITVNNSIPETILEGTWEVAPHFSDPPHTPDFHTWISFRQAKFVSNQVECKITIDTSKLMANKTYKREVLLHTNSSLETHSLIITVQTAPIPIAKRKLPYPKLVLLLGLYFSLGWLVDVFAASAMLFVGAWVLFGSGAVFKSLNMAGTIVRDIAKSGAEYVAGAAAATGMVIGALAGFIVGLALGGVGSVPGAVVGGVVGLLCAGLIGVIVGVVTVIVAAVVGAMAVVAGAVLRDMAIVEIVANKGFSRKFAVSISLLLAGLGTSLGIGCRLGFLNPFLLAATLGTALSLVAMILYPPFQRSRLIAKYRFSEQNLIKP